MKRKVEELVWSKSKEYERWRGSKCRKEGRVRRMR
jgi:hypothetical protein